MVVSTIDLGISILMGGNTDVQKVCTEIIVVVVAVAAAAATLNLDIIVITFDDDRGVAMGWILVFIPPKSAQVNFLCGKMT